jgi:hypothetical protein
VDFLNGARWMVGWMNLTTYTEAHFDRGFEYCKGLWSLCGDCGRLNLGFWVFLLKNVCN